MRLYNLIKLRYRYRIYPTDQQNASANILKVAGGQLDTKGALSNSEGTSPWVAPKNGRAGRRKTTS